MSYPTLGNAWKITNTLKTKESLVVRDLDSKGQKFQWRCIEVASGKIFPLGAEGQPARPEAIYSPDTQELIFSDVAARFNSQGQPVNSQGHVERPQTGIWSFHLRTGKEILLCELDTDIYETILVSASPDGRTIYFLQNKRGVPISQVVKGAPAKADSKESILFRFNRADGKLTAATDILHGITSYDMNWKTNAFFVTTLDQEFNTELIRFDLLTSLATVLKRFPKRMTTIEAGGDVLAWPEYLNVSIARNGDILLFGSRGSGISRFIPPDTETEIIMLGLLPASSPDGTKLAFIRTVNNGLWIKEGDGEPTLIYSFSHSGMSSKPAWCFCGNHLVASLISTDADQKGVTVVADVQKKELLTIEHHRHPYVPDGHIWVPETVARFGHESEK